MSQTARDPHTHALYQTYPRDFVLTRFCPGRPLATLQPGASSPTLPTSNDHDHDFVSYGGCRWEDGMKRMERGKELKPRERRQQRARDGGK